MPSLLPGQTVLTMPGETALNQRLAHLGLRAQVKIVTRDAGLKLNRRQPKHVTTEQQRESWLDLLYAHSQAAAQLLGFETGGPNILPITGISHTDWPQDLRFNEMVRDTVGAGFIPDHNPHKPCLALVSDRYLSTHLGFITPFADAAPLYLVYVGRSRVFTVNALVPWHRAMRPFGKGDELAAQKPDLIGRIFQALRVKLKEIDEPFEQSRIMAFVGPAANAGFYIDPGSEYSKLLSPQDLEQFTTKRVVPAESTRIGLPRGDCMVEVTEFFFQSWVASMLTRIRVPGDQVFVMPHNTLTQHDYASDRRQPGDTSGSNVMLTRLHSIR